MEIIGSDVGCARTIPTVPFVRLGNNYGTTKEKTNPIVKFINGFGGVIGCDCGGDSVKAKKISDRAGGTDSTRKSTASSFSSGRN